VVLGCGRFVRGVCDLGSGWGLAPIPCLTLGGDPADGLFEFHVTGPVTRVEIVVVLGVLPVEDGRRLIGIGARNGGTVVSGRRGG
jgi:hypothetical protein